MVLSLCSVTAFAEPAEQLPEIASQSLISGDEAVPAEEVTNQPVEQDTDLPSAEINEEAENTDENPSSVSSDSDVAEDEVTSESEAAGEEEIAALSEEEIEFEETGIFDLSVTDHNGVEVKPWFDSSSNIYYLFLTNAVSIPEMVLEVQGVRMAKTSRGTLDPKTNKVTGAFSASGEGITLTGVDGHKYNIIVKQSGIPSLSITLNGVSLSTINGGSKTTKYPGNKLILTDAAGNINVSQSDVEMKGRGNTTWDYSEKKPYQIKFAKKQSVLGMAKAKKWVLLASAFDDSMLRNKAAFYAGDALGMPFSPDLEFCDLWVDGEYRGTYSIGEKCEITDTRLNLTDPLGALVEYDGFFYRQEDYWYRDDVIGTSFALSDSVDEDQGQAALNAFKGGMDKFRNYLYNTPASAVTVAGLSRYINVEEAAKWYLVNEYMSNVESYSTSWFWYQNGPADVLHMGPLWDFDTSQGIPGNWSGTDFMFGKTHNGIFRRLMASPEFSNYVKNVYKQYRGVFSGLPTKVSQWGNALKPAADGNYTRWKWLGGKNLKGKPFATTYQGAINDQVNWLAARDAQFGINVPAVPGATTSASVSSSGKVLTVKATNIRNTSSIQAAVWSKTNGQDDIKWYPLTKNSDGSMSTQINLKNHGGSDTYFAHVYSGSTCLGTHTLDVTMVDSVPEMTASFEPSDRTIRISVKNVDQYTSLDTAVWSDINAQDDIKWYSKSVAADGTVNYTVKVSDHKGTGLYQIHVYGRFNGKQVFACKTTVDVPDLPKPEVTAVQDAGGSDLTITAKNITGFSALRVAVWGALNGQNDLKWYNMAKQSNGDWSVTVDSATHKETGLFYLHVYGTKNSNPNNFVGSTTLTVAAPSGPTILVNTVSEGNKYQAVLKNASACDSVTFAVWGNENAQNDIKWYTGKKSGGNWIADISIQNHRETGVYYVHAYGTKSGKQTFQDGCTFTVEHADFPRVDLTVSDSGKRAVASLENCDSYTAVKMAVWSQNNAQDDIKWVNATRNLDGSWTASIDVYSHKDTGLYHVHAYGTKNGKDQFAASNTFTIPAFKGISVSTEDKGKNFLIKTVNADDYTSVRAAVWTVFKDQDDLKWYQLYRCSDGSFRYTVDSSRHGGNGTYNVHFYGTKNGKETLLGKAVFIEDSFDAATIQSQLSEDGTTLTITSDNPVGYSKIQVAVWGAVNGQNDIKWYTLKEGTAGTYTATVKVADHGEKGDYYFHAYGWCGSVQLFMGSTTCKVS